MGTYIEIVIFFAGFALIAFASKQIGGFFTKANLPLITGFLFTGIIAGPYVLGLIPVKATENLRFVDEISLAFIAFAAGNELYMRELKSRFKSIRWVTFGLVTSTFTLGSFSVYMLAEFIPFMNTMSAVNRLAVSILAGAILVARSPSSAIAVVNELRAKGPFTRTALGVTVIMDVVVISLFSVNSSIADALFTGLSFDISFIFLLVAELGLSLLAGYGLGKILQLILSFPVNRTFKASLIVLAGYGIFISSAAIRTVSHARLSFDVLLEPLLICMIASFLTTNYSSYRTELLKILHDIGPLIYVAFFTLTGASLALNILAKTWTIALALFGIRLLAIFIGSFSGGLLAGDPMKHNRIGWMSYITQAGVGLGLAKEVAVEFPEWGTAFATVIISIIVLNQILGPPFFRWAIHLVGETHPRGETPEFDGIRDAIIFGLEGQSLALARLLRNNGWEVKIASRKVRYVEEMDEDSDIEIHAIADISLNELNKLNTGQAEAIVTMLTDEENYRICELAYEHYGTQNIIVRLNNRANFKMFHELGALIVDPTTAIVSLLDHFVRSPSAATLLLGMEKNQDVIEFELRNRDLNGILIRDLRLPLDIHILSVRRGRQILISHGYTRLEVGDWVTVVGSVPSIEQMMLRFDTNREVELVNLVERATPTQLATRSLETEVKEIIRDKDKVRKDRFDIIIEESIVIDIDRSMGLEEFFRLVSKTMSRKLKIEPDIIFKSLIERENDNSTAFTPLLAIPHVIIDGENNFSVLLARCRDGIYFSELAPKVQAVFVLVGTEDERNYHLRALSTIAEIVQDPHFEKKWLRAKNEKAIRDVLLLRKDLV